MARPKRTQKLIEQNPGHDVYLWPGHELEVKQQLGRHPGHEVVNEEEFVSFFNGLSQRAKQEVVDYYKNTSAVGIALDVASFIPAVRAARLANKLFCFVRKKGGYAKGSKGGGGGSSSASDEAPTREIKAHETRPAAAAPAPNDRQAVTRAGNDNKGASQKNDTQCGDPISMVSGEEVLQLDDLALPGPIPFVWRRLYRSGQRDDMGLGHGWSHSGGETLHIKDGVIELRDAEGRTTRFARPALGQRSKHLSEGIDLDFVSPEQIILRQPGEVERLFTPFSPNLFHLTELRHAAYQPAQSEWREERGFVLRLHRNAEGVVTRVLGNWGRGLKMEHDGQGRIRAIHLLNEGNEVLEPPLARYEYNGEGDLIAHRNADGHGDRYEYQNHMLVRRTLASGYRFHFEWDRYEPGGRCLRQWGDHGFYDYRFEWDTANRISHATNGRGFRSSYHHNRWGRLDRRIDSGGHETRYHYNESGQLIEEIDPLGHATRYHIGADSRPMGMTDALGHRTSLGWFQGQVVRFNDAERNSWQRSFNRRGLVESLTAPNGAVTRFEYTPDGLIHSVTLPDGRATHYRWNDRAELLRETDPLGNTTHFDYDPCGRVSRVTLQARGQDPAEAQQGAVHYRYSAAGRVEEIRTREGSHHYRYNEHGMLTRYSDAQGRVTEYRYEHGLNQPVERIDPDGQRLRYEYDAERLLTALINENGDRYSFEYDGEERLIRETGFDGRVQAYEYNGAGHLIRHVDGGEVEHRFERDALGRMVKKTSRRLDDDETSFAGSATSHYRYDALSRLTESHNGRHYAGFKYDPFGNVLSETSADLDAGRAVAGTTRTTTHRYDQMGARIATTLDGGEEIRYGYHPGGGLSELHYDGRLVSRIERNSLGQEVSRQQGALTTESDYDPQGRLIKQQARHRDSRHTLIQRDYGYHPGGTLAHLREASQFGSREIKYLYDTLDRLKRTEGSLSERFSFDPAGNLLALDDTARPAPGLVKGNRLLIQGDSHFTYDARGNLIEESRGKEGKLTSRYRYDLDNRLIEVQSGPRTVRFSYDPLGRRIHKSDASGTTTFHWSGHQLTGETRNGQSKRYLLEPNSHRPLALVQDGQIYHYHLDHLGTPQELSCEAGRIVWKATYRTYGATLQQEVAEIENNLRFQGQYFDEETGLHYNRFRYYNPNSGQFINQDPIGLLGGVNNYQYTPNPVNWVDPLGLSCREGNCKIPDNYDPLTDTFIGPHGFSMPDGDPNELVTIYRGVHPKHPDYQNALTGKAVPWGGHRNPVLHNKGENRSDFTSWTTDLSVAEEFSESEKGSIVLKQKVMRSELIASPDKFSESEVLRLGPTSGAQVLIK